MPHKRGNEIRQLYESMAYNEVSTVSLIGTRPSGTKPLERRSICTDQAISDLVKRHDICQEECVPFDDDNELSKRLFEIADMVEKDRRSLNNIFSKRVPVAIETPTKDIDLLISFCRYYAMLISQNKLWRQINIDGGTWPQNAVSAVYYTLSIITQSSHIQLYLKHISFGPRVILGGQSSIDTAMIVLVDADLDSAIDTLTSERVGKTDYLDRPLWYLKKIWIQEPVKDKFVRLIDELQIKEDTSSIKLMLHGFRNKDEVIQNLAGEAHIKAVAIWSSDVVTAKNMANAMDRVFLVWINSYGEIGPGISLPWVDVEHRVVNLINTAPNLHKRTDGKKTIDLFYDGVWKEPMDENYWKAEDDTLWANATWSDIVNCVASAEKAFEKWHLFPLSQRQKCFYYLANRVQSNGDWKLSQLIRACSECPNLCGSSSTRIRDGEVEIITTREPKGLVVIASDESHHILRRMVYACVAGNCVIVANGGLSPKRSGIEEYCDLLATCGFPPGVINSLSFPNVGAAVIDISNIRSIAITCTDHFSALRTENADLRPVYWIDTESACDSLDERLYTKYTRPKSIWLPLK